MRYPVIILVWLVLLAGCRSDEPEVRASATTTLFPLYQVSDSTYTTGDQPRGTASFIDLGDRVEVTIEVSGLIPNWAHAIHLHHGSCQQPRHHWNQMDTASFCNVPDLGQVWGKPKAGDVGNIETDENGNGSATFQSGLWRLGSEDHMEIIGTVMVIHEGPEDFAQECFQKHTHVHQNRKIACGTVELLND